MFVVIAGFVVEEYQFGDETVLPTLMPFPDSAEPVEQAFNTTENTLLYEFEASSSARSPNDILLPDDGIVQREIVLQFDEDTSLEAREAYIETIGGDVVETIEPLNTVLIVVGDDHPTDITALPLREQISAEPNYYVRSLADIVLPVSDPYYPDQWALDAMGVEAAWQALPDALPEMVVAVIDSGICHEHADLQGSILDGGYDFVEDDATAQDEHGHGCAIAGIIGAKIDNRIGIAGIAPNAAILPLRVLDENGIGTYANVAAAIVYAADHDAQFINLSLGGLYPSILLEQAVDYATAKGVTVIAAAGNTGQAGVLYPAAYADVIAVGSVDATLEQSSFSTYGPEIDLLTPGSQIVTTGLNDAYVTLSGTSMAAAHATGVAVLEAARGETLQTDGGILTLSESASPDHSAEQPADEGNRDITALACDYTIAAGDTAGFITAIEAANISGVADEICLTESTYLLTSVNNTSSTGHNGLPLITGEMVIQGNGATITRSGTDNFRFFSVESTGTLTLNTVSLTNGTVFGRGGAMYSEGQLIIIDSTFADNQALGSSTGIGGAIYTTGQSNSLSVSGSTFENNTSRISGGGITTFSPTLVTVSNSTFIGNLVTDTYQTKPGGGIASSSAIHVSDSTFIDNEANSGGALYSSGVATVHNSYFEGNHGRQYGGAMAQDTDSLTITDSILVNNTSGTNGSALTSLTFRTTPGGEITISQSCIVGHEGITIDNRGKTMDARNVWWGAYDGPSDDGSGHGDPTQNPILYLPFLTTPPFSECPVLPPVPTDQTIDVVYQTFVDFTLAAEGGLPAYTFTNISAPAHGTLTGTAPNLRYTPDVGFFGSDSFTFDVVNSTGESATGTITFDVDTDLEADPQTLHTAFNTAIDLTLTASNGTAPYVFDNISATTNGGTVTGTPPNVTYAPAADFVGTDSFTFDVTDSDNFTRTGTIEVVVAPELIVDDRYFYVTPDEPFAFSIWVVGGRAPFTYSVTDPTKGILTGTAPNLTYTYDGSEAGVDHFDIEVTDVNGAVTTANYNFSTNPTPLQADDTVLFTAYETEAFVPFAATGGVLPYTFESPGQAGVSPEHGVLIGSGLNLVYRPDAGYSGVDFISYEVIDSEGFRSSANMTIHVGEPLEFDDQTLFANYETSIDLVVEAQGGSAPLAYTIGTPANGAVSGDIPNLTYTPNAGFSGTDSFTVDVTDAIGVTRQVLITIHVSGTVTIAAGDVNGLIAAIEAANASPEPDTLLLTTSTYTLTAIHSTTDEGFVGFPPITSEIAIQGNGSTITRDSSDKFRLIEIMPSGALTLEDVTLSNGEADGDGLDGGAVYNEGDFIIKRSIVSGNIGRLGGGISNFGGEVWISETRIENNTGLLRGGGVYNGNATPLSKMYITRSLITQNTAGGENGPYDELGGGIFSSNYLEITDSTVTNNTALYSGGGFHFGTLNSFTLARNTCIYDNSAPNLSDISLSYSNSGPHDFAFNWWGDSNHPSSDRVSVRIIRTDHLLTPPEQGCVGELLDAQDATFEVFYETATEVTLPVMNGMPPFSFSNITTPANGILSGSAPNLIYTPDAEFTGTDTFSYTVTDYLGTSDSGTITLVLTNDLEGTPIAALNKVNTDIDLTLEATGGQAPYQFAITNVSAGAFSGTAPNLTYTPPTDFVGFVDFTFDVTDDLGFTVQGSGTIEMVPAPTLSDQYLYVEEGTPLPISIPVTGGIPPLVYELSEPTLGTVTGEAPSLVYTLNPSASGLDSISITVTDAENDTGTATIYVTTGTRLTAHSGSVVTAYETSVSLPLSASDGVPPYTYAILSTPANGTLSGTAPNLTYTPNNGFFGTDSIAYEVTDDQNYKASAIIEIEVGDVFQCEQSIVEHRLPNLTRNCRHPLQAGLNLSNTPSHNPRMAQYLAKRVSWSMYPIKILAATTASQWMCAIRRIALLQLPSLLTWMQNYRQRWLWTHSLKKFHWSTMELVR